MNIGTIKESFIARLHNGDRLVLAGLLLEFIRVQDMTVYVKKAEKNKGRHLELERRQNATEHRMWNCSTPVHCACL